jgi:hypothetical protein
MRKSISLPSLCSKNKGQMEDGVFSFGEVLFSIIISCEDSPFKRISKNFAVAVLINPKLPFAIISKSTNFSAAMPKIK